jgi:hypothetical protein
MGTDGAVEKDASSDARDERPGLGDHPDASGFDASTASDAPNYEPSPEAAPVDAHAPIDAAPDVAVDSGVRDAAHEATIPVCNAFTCPYGCCSDAGACVAPATEQMCGTQGAACEDCTTVGAAYCTQMPATAFRCGALYGATDAGPGIVGGACCCGPVSGACQAGL